MDNLKIYQICYDLIDYFATLTSPKKSHLGPIFRTRGSILLIGRHYTRTKKKSIASQLMNISLTKDSRHYIRKKIRRVILFIFMPD